MKIKRILCAALAAVMVLVLVPAAAMAKGAASEHEEARKLGLLGTIWADLGEIEAEALASGASRSEVTLAVYKAALQHELVDEKSFNSLTDKSFFFTVEGMNCCYDYDARNFDAAEALDEPTVITIPGTKQSTAPISKNGPTNMNVLLVAPYYGHDSSFTDQYKQEAQSIAATTGGDYTLLQSTGATGPAIAAAAPDAGVIIYDSHGTQSGTSSYLCLTTNSGITSEDYSNGWAVNAGSAAYIDGRYVQHHITSELPNTMFWMAICEGMKRQGQGTTGYALLEAGAGCVYGYSQSVTFAGDYKYEATFWNEMKNNNATVAEAFDVMIDTWGEPDPHGDAWAIVMSPDDPFPSNPDSHQDVNCDWQLFGGSMDPVALESWSLSETAVQVYEGFTYNVSFDRVPNNANQYELVWHSENEQIATVDGNNRRVTISGVNEGSTSIYCEVYSTEDQSLLGNAYCNVNVLNFPTLQEAANVTNGHLEFTNATPNYPWTAAIVDGRGVAKSGGQGVNNVTSTLRLVLQMQAGETLSFDWKASCEGSSNNPWDKGQFFVNNSQFGGTITGSGNWTTVTYTANAAGTYTFEWRYTKDSSVNSNDDCIYVDNVEYSGDDFTVAGDMNGDGQVGVEDALMLLRAAMGLIQNLTEQQLIAADANGDGEITLDDALYVLRKAMNLI